MHIQPARKRRGQRWEGGHWAGKECFDELWDVSHGGTTRRLLSDVCADGVDISVASFCNMVVMRAYVRLNTKLTNGHKPYRVHEHGGIAGRG